MTNRRRIKSLGLMETLSSFVQGGIISPANAKEITDKYVQGDNSPLSELINNPALPVAWIGLTNALREYIQ